MRPPNMRLAKVLHCGLGVKLTLTPIVVGWMVGTYQPLFYFFRRISIKPSDASST